MSATSTRAADRTPQHTELSNHCGATAFDVERIHVPFGADIGQLAHAISRLLDSGSRIGDGPINRPRRTSLSPTCISGELRASHVNRLWRKPTDARQRRRAKQPSTFA